MRKTIISSGRSSKFFEWQTFRFPWYNFFSITYFLWSIIEWYNWVKCLYFLKSISNKYMICFIWSFFFLSTFFSLLSKSVFFTKLAISFLLTNFACANLEAKFSNVNLNSDVVIYWALSWSVIFSILLIFVS